VNHGGTDDGYIDFFTGSLDDEIIDEIEDFLNNDEVGTIPRVSLRHDVTAVCPSLTLDCRPVATSATVSYYLQ
jgi:hypothetical protein